jgi:uncharacterized metal-binding protein YceD (DUF177 family)
MHIHSSEIAPEKHLIIAGDEAWLDSIYADFAAGGDLKPRRLTGELHLFREEGGSVRVSGQLAFTPMISCSRCAKNIPWPLALAVDVRFLPVAEDLGLREKNLSRAELEAYYLEGGLVDIGGLVNDLIQTELPARAVASTDDGKACRICLADLTTEQVFGSTELGGQSQARETANPFAALKSLKLKR